MKRSGWVTGVVVMQSLLALCFVGTCVFLLTLIGAPEVKPGQDAAAAIRGLKVAAGVVGPLALVVAVSAYGLWKSRLWGWWLALFTDMGLLGAFVYGMIDDGWGDIDWDMFAITTAVVVLVVLLLLPVVRRFYWRGAENGRALRRSNDPKANEL